MSQSFAASDASLLQVEEAISSLDTEGFELAPLIGESMQPEPVAHKSSAPGVRFLREPTGLSDATMGNFDWLPKHDTFQSSDMGPAPLVLPTKDPLQSAVDPETEKDDGLSQKLADLWQRVLTDFKKKDDAMLKDFDGEIDTLLVFAGLFSAVLTAFIVDVYKRLEEDPAGTSNTLLKRISMQLEGLPVDPLKDHPPSFRPSGLIIAVNVLWFASLIFSLFAALVGILAKQWIHVYSKWDEGPSDQAETKLRLRDLYQQGLTKSHVPEIIGLLPVFLQIALFLFLFGLTAFLINIQPILGGIITFMALSVMSLAFYSIILPVFDRKCMYKTPLLVHTLTIWDNLAQLFKKSGALTSLPREKIRSYTLWRDHDVHEILAPHKDENNDKRTLARISLVLDIRPPLAWATLATRTDLRVQRHELAPPSRKLLDVLLISLLRTTRQNNHEHTGAIRVKVSQVPQILRLVYPLPDLVMLESIRKDLILHQSTMRFKLDADTEATLATIAVAQTAYPRLLTHEHIFIWGLNLLCVAMEKLVTEIISKDTEEAQVEKTRLSCGDVWLIFESWVQHIPDDRTAEEPIYTKCRETLVLDCFMRKQVPGVTGNDVQSALNTILRLERAFPQITRLQITWWLFLLNDVTERTIEVTEDIWLESTDADLHKLSDMLYRWVMAAVNNGHSPDDHIIVRSFALLKKLFYRVCRSQPASCTYQRIPNPSGRITSLSLSPNGTRMVVGETNGLIRIWDLLEHDVVGVDVMPGHTKRVTSVAFSPDGTRIASGSYDAKVRIWDAETRREQFVMSGRGLPVMCVAFSPTASMVISGSSDGTATIWNCATGNMTRMLEGHVGLICSAAFSGDGLRAATGGADHTVRIWDPETGTLLQVIDTHHRDHVWHVEFVTAENHILSRDGGWMQKYWRAPEYSNVQVPSQFEEMDLISASPFTFDQRTRYLLCWSSETQAFRPILKIPGDIVPSAWMFCFAGKTLVFGPQRNDSIYVRVDCSPVLTPSGFTVESPLEHLPSEQSTISLSNGAQPMGV